MGGLTGLANFPIPWVGSLIFWQFRWGGGMVRNPPTFVGWSNITQPLLFLGFYPYLYVKIGVGKQKEQVGGSTSHFVHSAGGGMKKIASPRVGTPKNLEILVGVGPKIRTQTSSPPNFSNGIALIK